MKSSIAAKPLAQIETPLLAVAVAQGTSLSASLGDLDRAAGGVLARALGAGDYKGKRDETLLMYGSGKALCEDLAACYRDDHGVDSIGLRLGVLYGPWCSTAPSGSRPSRGSFRRRSASA